MDDMQKSYFKSYMKGRKADDLESIVQWINDNMEPEEVFTEGNLEMWAVGHGMTTLEQK